MKAKLTLVLWKDGELVDQPVEEDVYEIALKLPNGDCIAIDSRYDDKIELRETTGKILAILMESANTCYIQPTKLLEK